jgi:hypothetical protein
MAVKLQGLVFGNVYRHKQDETVLMVIGNCGRMGHLECKTRSGKSITKPIQELLDNFTEIELCNRAKYIPIDKSIRAGFTAQVIRSSVKKDTVTFWCGGQKLTGSYRKFALEYRPAEWKQTGV